MKVKIEKPQVPSGKRTNIKMTYVHTYNTIDGTASLTASSDGLAANVSLSYSEKQWRVGITVDVDY